MPAHEINQGRRTNGASFSECIKYLFLAKTGVSDSFNFYKAGKCVAFIGVFPINFGTVRKLIKTNRTVNHVKIANPYINYFDYIRSH